MKQFLLFSFLLFTIPSFLSNTDGKSFEEDLTLTISEKKALDKFKELVVDRLPHDYMKEDVYLIRWLRARSFNIRDAERMLIDHIKWREENEIDTILQEDWSDMYKDYKFHLEGNDVEGKPLLYINGGSWDLRKAVLSGRRERFNRYIDYGLEEACTKVRNLGEMYKNVSQGILILNIDGFNLVQHGCIQCLTVFLRIITQYEAHHPGCADKIFVVNMPHAAEPLLNAARAVLNAETNKSLHIHGTNKKQWKEVLSQYFDEDQLPRELGGTKTYKDTEDYDYNF